MDSSEGSLAKRILCERKKHPGKRLPPLVYDLFSRLSLPLSIIFAIILLSSVLAYSVPSSFPYGQEACTASFFFMIAHAAFSSFIALVGGMLLLSGLLKKEDGEDGIRGDAKGSRSILWGSTMLASGLISFYKPAALLIFYMAMQCRV